MWRLKDHSSVAVAAVALGLLALAATNAPAAAEEIRADLGERAFDQLGCLSCHSVAGRGGTEASNLRHRSPTNENTPAAVASRIWNHAPEMWQAMDPVGTAPPRMSVDQANNIFAYLWSNRYFDPLGEAIRGKQAFTEKGCGSCHALRSSEAEGSAPAVDTWTELSDPVMWAQALWNHSRPMAKLYQEEGRDWPKFSEQEMTDLLLYLQSGKQQWERPRQLVLRSSEPGAMFERKACSACHAEPARGQSDLSRNRDFTTLSALKNSEFTTLSAPKRRGFTTLTALSAAMWNHAPGTGEGATENPEVWLDDLSRQEMDSIVLQLMRSGALDDRGNPAKGARLFVKKGCVSCHGAGGAVPFAASAWPISAPSMVSAAWNHGPAMSKRMELQGVSWPTLSTREMQDLLAYLGQESLGETKR